MPEFLIFYHVSANEQPQIGNVAQIGNITQVGNMTSQSHDNVLQLGNFFIQDITYEAESLRILSVFIICHIGIKATCV